jgi:hypothetical protein
MSDTGRTTRGQDRSFNPLEQHRGVTSENAQIRDITRDWEQFGKGQVAADLQVFIQRDLAHMGKASRKPIWEAKMLQLRDEWQENWMRQHASSKRDTSSESLDEHHLQIQLSTDWEQFGKAQRVSDWEQFGKGQVAADLQIFIQRDLAHMDKASRKPIWEAKMLQLRDEWQRQWREDWTRQRIQSLQGQSEQSASGQTTPRTFDF